MEARQKPLPAPHTHLLIDQRRVGGGSQRYRIPIAVPFRARPQSHSPGICSSNVQEAPALGQALAVSDTLILSCQGGSACPTPMNESISGSELASSCLNAELSSQILAASSRPPRDCYYTAPTPLELKGSSSCWGCPIPSYLSEVPDVPLLMGLLSPWLHLSVPSD